MNRRNLTAAFVSLLSLVLPFVLSLPFSPPSLAGDCDSMCGITKENAKNLISDPECKKDQSCVDCVASAVTGSQVGSYCSAYNRSEKGKAGQIINASLNTAATITCGIACFASKTPVGGPAWNQICGFSGLAVTTAEVGFTLANIIGGDADLLELASSAAGTAATVRKSTELAKVGKKALQKTSEESMKNLKKEACWNAVAFGISAAAKSLSIGSMKKTSSSTCSAAQSLAGVANGAVQSCRAKRSTSSLSGNGPGPGLFAATSENYVSPKTGDVEHLAATSGPDSYLKTMKSDLDFAEKQGKIDLDHIAKRISDGENVSSIMADAGLPKEMVDRVKDAEARLKAGDPSKVLASLTGGGGYVAAGAGENSGAAASGASELAFGSPSEASPGDGASTLEIDRKPASTETLGSNGDVFHQSFGGSIFDIVSLRIKESKGTYAELEPESRLNRAFNGYSNKNEKKNAN